MKILWVYISRLHNLIRYLKTETNINSYKSCRNYITMINAHMNTVKPHLSTVNKIT